jgi:hypothetical protein
VLLRALHEHPVPLQGPSQRIARHGRRGWRGWRVDKRTKRDQTDAITALAMLLDRAEVERAQVRLLGFV